MSSENSHVCSTRRRNTMLDLGEVARFSLHNFDKFSRPINMADVFHQIYIHLVFSPKHRQALIKTEWEERLNQYITGIVQNKGHKLLAIGGMPDHIHIFIGLKPAESISDLVAEIKKSSNAFVLAEKFSPFKFDWQGGFGVFSHSRSQIDYVCKYILNQKIHHQKKTFREEFEKFCVDFGVEIGKKQMFEWVGEAPEVSKE
jgi:putative transposase